MDLFRNRHFHALFFGRLFTNIGDSVYGALAGAAGADKISRIFPFGKILAAGFLLSGLSWLLMILLSNVSIWYVYTLMFISELSIGAINVLFSAIFSNCLMNKC
ncbi:hypothetical protein [Heyndrickxia coagulans]|uniref:hypothetical protein n=1 Tax=Heyndrickxia coagulans TaxID=1398 RepID=UPI00031C7F62|nr:hypothetical protein [Heyndrickxia coagulans]